MLPAEDGRDLRRIVTDYGQARPVLAKLISERLRAPRAASCSKVTSSPSG
jgi:hypothetical protein